MTVKQTLEKSFACAVLGARWDRGLTQQQVAEVVGISVRWMQKIEHGKMPNGTTTIRLMLFLDIDPKQFSEEANLLVPIPARGYIRHR